MLPSGVAEGDERAPGLDVDLARVHAAGDELPPSGVGVLHDDLHTSLGARQHLSDAGAQHDRAVRAGRRELHETQAIVDLVVMVGMKADLLHIEGLGAVDVGDGHGNELELPVHSVSVCLASSTAEPPTPRWRSGRRSPADSARPAAGLPRTPRRPGRR